LGYEGEDSLTVPADKLLLREALSNLIDNALRYAGTGASVTLRTRREGAHCIVEVEDNGPGLQSPDIERVFERFWRASELPGGCGLGLSIVAEIAHRHGGEARAQGLQPQGFRVVLTLPNGR
jgi:two-component system sensor histidine kinase TctE